MRRGSLPGRGCAVLVLAACLVCAAHARAGGAPEGLFLVVNNGSWASKSVANVYIDLRRIPASHVLYLDGVPGRTHARVDKFRDRILFPVLEAIQQRGLAGQIDVVAYSSDFPSAIYVGDDIGDVKLPKVITPYASLTGLTYLHQFVAATNINYLSLTPNFYMRRIDAAGVEIPDEETDPAGFRDWKRGVESGEITVGVQETRGFRNMYGWSMSGDVVPPNRGVRYLLSAMLAVTGARGNSWEQIRAHLESARDADGSRPAGTVYFTQTDDPRVQARVWALHSAARLVRAEGVAAKVVRDTDPFANTDVAGATLGTKKGPAESWQPVLPGAFIDNMTSFGGVLDYPARQVALTDFLGRGAAGAHGAVSEPYAVHEKFPSPFVHVHYVRGCTLAEAFYQSVSAPYQLLLVGDPLCRPWAQPGTVRIEGISPGAVVSNIVTLTPELEGSGPCTAKSFELYIGGRRVGVAPAGAAVRFDSRLLLDGWHDLTLVATDRSKVESAVVRRMPVQLKNYGPGPELTASRRRVRLGDALTLEARMPGATALTLFHNSRALLHGRGASARFDLDSTELGLGPARLLVIGSRTNEEGLTTRAVSRAIVVEVEPPEALPALAKPAHKLVDGFRVKPVSGAPFVATELDGHKVLKPCAQCDEDGAFTMEAYFRVERTGLHQLELNSARDVRLRVDGTDLRAPVRNTWHRVPLALEQGWHRLVIEAAGGGGSKMDLRFGQTGTQPAPWTWFKCVAP